MSCVQKELDKRYGLRDRIRYFDECQGGRAAGIVWNGTLIWESGSNRELTTLPSGGVLMDSCWYDLSDSREVRKLLSFQRRFLEQKVVDATKEFDAARREGLRRTRYAEDTGTAPPSKDEIEQVKRLKRICKQWMKKLDDVYKKLDPQQTDMIPLSVEQLEEMKVNRDEAQVSFIGLSQLEL